MALGSRMLQATAFLSDEVGGDGSELGKGFYQVWRQLSGLQEDLVHISRISAKWDSTDPMLIHRAPQHRDALVQIVPGKPAARSLGRWAVKAAAGARENFCGYVLPACLCHGGTKQPWCCWQTASLQLQAVLGGGRLQQPGFWKAACLAREGERNDKLKPERPLFPPSLDVSIQVCIITIIIFQGSPSTPWAL